MKKVTKSLRLSTQTVRELQGNDLKIAGGVIYSAASWCDANGNCPPKDGGTKNG